MRSCSPCRGAARSGTRRSTGPSSAPTRSPGALGDDGGREPRDGRGVPGRAGRAAPLRARHLAPRVRPRRRAAGGARALRAAALDGHVGRLRAHAAVPGAVPLRRRRRARKHAGRAPAGHDARPAGRRCGVAAGAGRPHRDRREHRAPDGGHARAESRRGGPARPRGRRAPVRALRCSVGARVARRGGPRVRARGGRRLLRADRRPARVPKPRPGPRRGDRGDRPSYLP